MCAFLWFIIFILQCFLWDCVARVRNGIARVGKLWELHQARLATCTKYLTIEPSGQKSSLALTLGSPSFMNTERRVRHESDQVHFPLQAISQCRALKTANPEEKICSFPDSVFHNISSINNSSALSAFVQHWLPQVKKHKQTRDTGEQPPWGGPSSLLLAFRREYTFLTSKKIFYLSRPREKEVHSCLRINNLTERMHPSF